MIEVDQTKHTIMGKYLPIIYKRYELTDWKRLEFLEKKISQWQDIMNKGR